MQTCFHWWAVICAYLFSLPPATERVEGRGGWMGLSSPPASRKETESNKLLRSQKHKFTLLPLWWITLENFFSFRLKITHILCLLYLDYCWFLGGGWQSPWKVIYPLLSTVAFCLLALPAISNHLLSSSSGALLLHLNFLPRFHHLLTHPLTLPRTSHITLFFGAASHTYHI